MYGVSPPLSIHRYLVVHTHTFFWIYNPRCSQIVGVFWGGNQYFEVYTYLLWRHLYIPPRLKWRLLGHCSFSCCTLPRKRGVARRKPLRQNPQLLSTAFATSETQVYTISTMQWLAQNGNQNCAYSSRHLQLKAYLQGFRARRAL
jgi:hypothetical protein